MPELPEVERARTQLEGWLVGRRLGPVEVPNSRLLRGQDPAEVAAILQGAKVQAVLRHGKHLLMSLDRGRGLYLHLGMTGKFVRRSPGEEVRHGRLSLGVGAVQVVFSDPRLFGRIAAGPKAALEAEFFEPLGPDAWREPLDAAGWAARLAHTRRPIKVVLLEQGVVAGLGNIYAAEALFGAKIHPDRPASSLDRRELAALTQAVRRTLARALQALSREEEVTYLSEGADNPFQVYERAGEPCVRCATAIARKVQGGRSTYYCPRCQNLPNAPPLGRGPRPARPKRETGPGPGRRRGRPG